MMRRDVLLPFCFVIPILFFVGIQVKGAFVADPLSRRVVRFYMFDPFILRGIQFERARAVDINTGIRVQVLCNVSPKRVNMF